MNPALEVIIERDSGKGRVFLVVYEANGYSALARSLSETLSSETRVVLIKIPSVTDNNWGELTESLRGALTQCGVRQASFVAFSGAASVVMNLALLDLKLVRTLVLVDSSTRPHPKLLDRIADRIERFLPLGLPLRSSGKGFDAKSFLQRLRCPVLIVTTSRAHMFLRREAEVFRGALPTGWAVELDSNDENTSLGRLVVEFQQIPAKCPQKNVA